MSKFQGALVGSTKLYSSKTPVAVWSISQEPISTPKSDMLISFCCGQAGRKANKNPSYGYLKKINVGVCPGLNSTYLTWYDKN